MASSNSDLTLSGDDILAPDRYPVRQNPFLPTVPTFAVRETCVSRHNGGASGAPLKPLRDDSALRALSSLRGLRGAPEVPPLCRETQVSRTANVGIINGGCMGAYASI